MIPNSIAVLNSDGTTDTSFAVGAGLNEGAWAVASLPNGRIIAGGFFTYVSGIPKAKLAIFEADGELVTGTPAFNNTIQVLTAQTDGSILLGGSFTTAGTDTRNGMARLLPNLTLEAGFNPDVDGTTYALALQEDGKILAGGDFSTVGSTTRNNVARLYNGEVGDSLYALSDLLIKWDRSGAGEETQRVSFELDTGSGYSPLAGTISRTATGWQIVPDFALSGSTNDVRATAFPSDSHSSGTHQTVASIPVLPEIAVTINNVPMTDGVSTFPFSALQVGATAIATVTISNTGLGDLTLTSDVTISGQWNIVSQPVTTIPAKESVSFDIRFAPTSEGSLSGTLSIFSDDSDEATFTVSVTGTATPGPGGLDLTWQPNANGAVRALTKSSDDFVMLGGAFTALGVTSRARLARIDENAVLQAQETSIIPAGTINCIAQLPDGTALVGGQFSTKKLYWVWINGAGSLALKNSFDILPAPASPTFVPQVYCMAVQADGTVLVGGNFYSIKYGTTTKVGSLAKVSLSSGVPTIDTSFAPATTDSRIYSLAVQTNGKIVCSSNGLLKRLNADGSLDTSLSSAIDQTGLTVLEASGAIIVNAPDGVKRVTSTGAADGTFALIPSAAYAVLPLTDGKVMIASGAFGTLASTSRLERFLSDGTADTSFVSTVTGTVNTLCCQDDGKLLIGGSFIAFSNTMTSARIVSNNTASTSLTVVDPTEVQWLRSGVLPETQIVVFDLSQNSGASWTRLGQGQRIAGGWHLPSIALPYSGLLRARSYIQSAGNSSIMEDQISFSGLAVSDLIVQVPNTEIVEDGGIASAVSAVAGSILPVTIRLVNTGLAEMTGVVATVTTAPVAGTGKWSLSSAPNSTIPAGGSSTMVANFTPSSSDKGLLYANLVITSSVPGIKNPYTVLLVGAAVALPTATTNTPNNTGGGVVTFNGTFVANDLTATAYFRYRLTSSSTWISTSTLSKSGYAAQTGSVTVSSLSIGVSYTVQAVIVNSSNVTSPVYGASVAFTPVP